MITWSRCLCFFAFSSLAYPQTPPDRSEPQITLDVVVTDKSDKPVAGLQQSEFTVLENKRPQKILSLKEVKGNDPNSGSQARVILVMDEINTAFKNVSYERVEVSKFLSRDNAVLLLPASLGFLTDVSIKFTDFSQDGNALIREMNANPPALRTITRDQGVYGAGDRIDMSLRGVSQIAAAASKQPGRKLVVWISPGWPYLTGPQIQLSSKDQQRLFGEVIGLSNALWGADVSIYSVDPLGTADAAGARTTFYQEFLKAPGKPQQVQFGNLALQVLAIQSGGRVFNSQNDLASEIASAISSATDYYVITYEGSPADGPNDYHSIDVKVTQPKLKVSARTGRYAQP